LAQPIRLLPPVTAARDFAPATPRNAGHRVAPRPT
jgi:hypothetical protein